MTCRWSFMKVDAVRGFFYYLGDRLLVATVLVPILLSEITKNSYLIFVSLNYTIHIYRILVGILLEVTEEVANLSVTFLRVQNLWAQKRIRSFTASVWVFAHRVLTYALVVTHALSLGGLRAAPLYIGISYMFLVAYNGIGMVFEGVSKFVEFRVAALRIKKFLLLEELKKTTPAVTKSDLRPKPEDCRVTISNLIAKWNQELEQNTLEDVSASVKAGELLAVIGPVGAGKSSLLMAILGELPVLAGNIDVKGKIAYVSQQAWVFSGSLRQNILFGRKYEKARFDKVVKASAMHKDLEIMPLGDSTLIGDRGVSLSGGQRARLSLARALYSDADIFLLDDPLSAVDAAVGRHIFDKCIQGVLRNKPRILVTHQLQYLKAADTILILKEGRAAGMGTFEELSNSGIDFAELLKTGEEEEEEKAQVSPSAGDHGPPVYVQDYSSTISLVSAISDFEPEPVQLPEEEERAKGTVGIKVYVEYFKAGAGIFKFLLLVLFNLVAQCTYIMSDWWLSRWSNAEEERVAAMEEHAQYLSQGYNETNVTIPYVDSHRNIYIFTGIIAGVFIFGMVRALLFFKVAVDASQKLHNTMFTRILRSPIGFFDTNPVGRILNRFAKDVGHMDDNLPITFFDFVQCFLLILGIVLVAGFVNPWVFIPTCPIILVFIWIRQYYLSTARSIKRLEGTTRSPVFSYLSASLQGLHTIRAFNMEDKCMEEFDAHQDLHSEAWFLFLSTTVSFCCVFAADSLDAGLVGLSITYSMTLMGLFQWGVRQSAEVENQMISVERVLEYSRLPSEGNLESDDQKKPPDDWPDKGAIQADNVCLQYFPTSPVVLKNLTFRIREKEKIGIVGRTGAGKSSLITCLFRLVEPKGSLTIDGVEITDIGLHDLRKNISIIPQDPVLFTGTLRKNLDPFYNHADDRLWAALAEVQLKEAVEELPSGLETSVSEGGVNFSVGQRQLICLARAILRHNRILLIDEATANVDPKTDELIQETIRDKFRECTVLTIAHRLHTIMDSDRVMVLSEGKIVEFEPPHLLLERKSGMFCDMVQQVGKTDAELLATIAAEAYNSRYNAGKNSNRSSGIESDKGGEGSDGEPHAVKAKKPVIVDDFDLQAPIAVAESFHSLLRHTSGDEDDEEEAADDESKDDQNTPLLSHDMKLKTDAGLKSAEATVPSVPGNGHQKDIQTSEVKDTSFEDDVFEDDALDENESAAVSVPVDDMQNSDHLQPKGAEEDKNGDASSRGEDQFNPSLLPRDESGIGTDVNGSSSDAEENSAGLVSPLDTPASEKDNLFPDMHKKGSTQMADVIPDGTGAVDAKFDTLAGNGLQSNATTHDDRDDEGNDATELDVLIKPSSGSESGADVRS
ncbi:hypothetical protein BaRGS_00029750 [Batillaria attramentaria]|uniref:Uncharacterized protein n=1 Tax=Batillaria attramentaria TaxID=370345 RepID=A0ABD0JW74_9CAEN